ncbi:hypothetical protein D9619_011247 [Psilocybe cf. subviscida]|uniref:Uncharacterized protein n=1 Tax=Psilocybe cf. subviscida TaxID=2480587 RepID=A0A8H5F597_9AGAR|nr:hypothetical protein D9619_011247 [Psilocybe cf. subviscida]
MSENTRRKEQRASGGRTTQGSLHIYIYKHNAICAGDEHAGGRGEYEHEHEYHAIFISSPPPAPLREPLIGPGSA